MELIVQSSENNIIRLGELIEHKLNKEKELKYYQEQLQELTDKIMTLQKDVDLTKLIINIITSETVVDIKEQVEKSIPIIGDKSGTNISK